MMPPPCRSNCCTSRPARARPRRLSPAPDAGSTAIVSHPRRAFRSCNRPPSWPASQVFPCAPAWPTGKQSNLRHLIQKLFFFDCLNKKTAAGGVPAPTARQTGDEGEENASHGLQGPLPGARQTEARPGHRASERCDRAGHSLMYLRLGPAPLSWPGARYPTHRIPLEEVADAYHLFSSKLDNCIKTVLVPPSAYSTSTATQVLE